MYQRLARHYDRPINELHMRTYPEALLDLPDDLLPLAFDRVIKTARFFPSVEEIRGAVALDNARQVEELWQPQWQGLLVYIKRNIHNPDAPMPPEVMAFPLFQAIEAIGGHSFIKGARWLADHHPFMYGIENWTSNESPRLAGERIEKRVRDLWESYR
jgi:hypothetical protein